MVAFSEAMYSGEHTVEGITSVRADTPNLDQYLEEGKIPIVEDPETKILQEKNFDIVIDARIAKRNLGTSINDAPIVIGLGPGFTAGVDCHAVVETLAGHNLGRVIYKGTAAKDTGTPIPPELYLNPCCAIPCYSGNEEENTKTEPGGEIFDVNQLVLRAPADGVISSQKNIGALVEIDEVIGKVGSIPVPATCAGVLRGCIHDGVAVTKGLKIGDIDPSGEVARVYKISEKANAIAGGVLEACLYLLNKNTEI
jgi:xanthine dehydrogenase accessory factor